MFHARLNPPADYYVHPIGAFLSTHLSPSYLSWSCYSNIGTPSPTLRSQVRIKAAPASCNDLASSSRRSSSDLRPSDPSWRSRCDGNKLKFGKSRRLNDCVYDVAVPDAKDLVTPIAVAGGLRMVVRNADELLSHHQRLPASEATSPSHLCAFAPSQAGQSDCAAISHSTARSYTATAPRPRNRPTCSMGN